MKSLPVFLVLLLLACNPYKSMRAERFDFASEKGPVGGNIKVPKGWKAVRNETDTAGRLVRLYDYSNGTVFYVAWAPKGGDIQPIPREHHIPKLLPSGDTIYKEMGASGRIWREDKKGFVRAGYINVAEGKAEALFDSAVNSVKAIR
jgi:hypothetical protein